MAQKVDTRQAPSGMAGLVRYYDEDKSLLKLKPEHVLAVCAGVTLIEIILMVVV